MNPDAPAPIFVINATNVQSGALWRFSKHDMRDYRVGQVCRPTVPLARAVAASSAFPPFLSPLILHLDPASTSVLTPEANWFGRTTGEYEACWNDACSTAALNIDVNLSPVMR